MKTITLEQLIQLHIIVIEQSGGGEGLRDLGRLESVVASQMQEVFDEPLNKDIYEKAAAIARGIVADHPFVDGNKRTAMLAATTLLRINGYNFIAEKGELEDFAVAIATEHLGIPTIAAWLKAHSDKL